MSKPIALDVLWARNLLRPADFGGSRYHWEVTRRLAARYRSFRIVTARPAGPLPGPTAATLRYYAVSRRSPVHTFLTHALGSRATIAAECRERTPDVIVLSSYEVAFAHLIWRHTGVVPTVFIYHSAFFSEAVERLGRHGVTGRAAHVLAKKFTRAVERVVVRRASRIIAVSPFSARTAAALRADGLGTITVVPTGTDTDAFSPGDRAAARERLGLPQTHRVLLAVGRLAFVKRFDRAIDALTQIRAVGKPVLLVIAGAGPEEAALRARARPLGSAVRFVGHIDGEMLRDHYRAADLTLCTSDFENWSVAILESLSAGTPVLGTPYGGTPELLSEVDASLVLPSGDPRALAARVMELLADAHNLERLRAVARATVLARFSWDRTASGVAAAIASATGR